MEISKNQILQISAVFAATAAAVYVYKKRRKKNWIIVPAVEPEDDMTLFDNKDLTPRKEFTGFNTVQGIKTGDQREKPNKEVADETAPLVLQTDDQWNWADETSSRGDTKPYVLHYEEFIEAASGFKQETVTWYEADDVVADTLDEPIARHESIMGALKFGHGSNDENVVYIRNPRLRMEWEVLRHTGSFAQEILGETLIEQGETELRHSYGSRRFRSAD